MENSISCYVLHYVLECHINLQNNTGTTACQAFTPQLRQMRSDAAGTICP